MRNGYQPKGSVGKPHDPPRHPDGGAEQERNFCPRCGKRLAKDGVHTCSPPRTDAPDSERQEPIGYWNGKEKAWFEHELCGHAAPDGCNIPIYTTPPTAAQAARQMKEAAVKVCNESLEEQSESGWNSAIRYVLKRVLALPIIGEEK